MGDLARLSQLARPERRRLALAAFLAWCALAAGVGLLATSAWLISRAAQQPPILYLQVAIVAVRAFGLSRGVFRYAERLTGHDAALRSLTELRVRIFARLERLAPAGLGSVRRGDLLARLVDDVDQAMDLQVRVWLPVSAALGVAGAGVLLGGFLLPGAGWALLAMVLIAGLAAAGLASQLGERANRDRAAAEGELSAVAVTCLNAAGDLFACGAQDRALADFEAADRQATVLAGRSAGASAWAGAVGTLTTGLTVVACLAAGISALSQGHLSGVNLAVLALLPLALAESLAALPTAALARARVAGAARRLCEVLDAPDPVRPGEQSVPPSGAPQCDLESVAARYPTAVTDAISDISLRLSSHTVALVGPSGSGKSTVAAVLVRFLDNNAGRATLNEAQLQQLSEDEVREKVGLLSQDPHLFDTTIAENVHLARRDASADDVRDALRRAALDEWIEQLPHGADTRVGAHGRAVSAGQRQRIALARTLLADRPIQLLDEPGEHLDPELADALLSDMTAALRGRALLLITHRMAAAAACDEVLVVAGGRVVEQGTPTELRAAGGWFADAWAREQGAGALEVLR